MMKKMLAILSAAAILVSFAACGKGTAEAPAETGSEAATSSVETTVDPTQPEVGRVKEMTGFYVYTPDAWCQRTYKGDGFRIELFDTPSAPDIKEGSTASVEIVMDAEDGTKETLDASVKALLAKKDAKQGKNAKIGGNDFTVVVYPNEKEERNYTVYTGLVDNKLATVTLKGISAKNEDVSAILKSISFK